MSAPAAVPCPPPPPQRCPAGALEMLLPSCGQGPGSLHLVSVFGTCAESGGEKGPGSCPVSRGQPSLARWLDAAPGHRCSPPRCAWYLATQQPAEVLNVVPAARGTHQAELARCCSGEGRAVSSRARAQCCALGDGPKGCAAAEQRSSSGAPAVVLCSRHRLQQLFQAGSEGDHVPEVRTHLSVLCSELGVRWGK